MTAKAFCSLAALLTLRLTAPAEELVLAADGHSDVARGALRCA